MSRWNDRVQAWLFSRIASRRLTQPGRSPRRSRSTPSIPSSTHRKSTGRLPARSLRSGRRQDAVDTVQRLRKLPQARQITRHICIEGWSAIGDWRGVPFKTFLSASGQTRRRGTSASSVPTATTPAWTWQRALHPQTQLTLDFGAQPLPTEYGFPLRLRVPTKLGFKNPKHIAASTSPTPTRAAIGKTKATTGSAGSDVAPPRPFSMPRLRASAWPQCALGPWAHHATTAAPIPSGRAPRARPGAASPGRAAPWRAAPPRAPATGASPG